MFTVSDFVHFGGFISTHGAVVDTLLPHFILSDAMCSRNWTKNLQTPELEDDQQAPSTHSAAIELI